MSVSPFFQLSRIAVEPRDIPQRKRGWEASLVVLPPAETHWNLRFGDSIGIRRRRPRRHVAAVYAVKLGRNILFATWTVHSNFRFQPACVWSPTSFGNRYSFPAEPKSTRISFRPKFSMSLTKIPCRGNGKPVFCDRISFVVMSESPVFILILRNSRLRATAVGKKHTGFALDLLTLSGSRRCG